MKDKLQQKLFLFYPKIFAQKDLTIQESCMAWGVTCGNGWYELIDTLCESVQSYILQENRRRKRFNESIKWWQPWVKPKPDIHFEATQVKEKFGGLRFYYTGGDENIAGMVRLAEAVSYRICDVCGSAGRLENVTSGYVATRCTKHRKMHWTASAAKKKGSVALDFDGVINSYNSGFVAVDNIPDPPVEGAFAFVEKLLSEKFKVYIYSTRNEQEKGRLAIREWLLDHGMPEATVDKLHIVSGKPIAKVYIDDRAWEFNGEFPDVDEIKGFLPWHGGKSSSQK